MPSTPAPIGRLSALLAALAICAAVLTAFAPPASAASLDQLRASGAVGERYDGLAVARDAAVESQVKAINAKRRQIYQEKAAAEGVSPEQVGRVYAKEIVAKAPKGTWFLREDGSWVQK